MRNCVILSPFFLDKALPELELLAKKNWLINKPSLPDDGREERMSAIHKAIAAFAVETISGDKRPVSIAGDCCTAMGMLAGLQQAGINPTLIWFDAHGDFNISETSPSGFLGGMPLAMMAGKGEQAMPEAVGLNAIPEHRVILTDARDLDPGERTLLAASAVIHLPKTEALLDCPLPDGTLYVHFDTDAVSLIESPAQNYPAQGGPSSAIMHSVFKRIAQTGRLVAVSLSAWNPELDKDKKSENVSMFLLETLVGDM